MNTVQILVSLCTKALERPHHFSINDYPCMSHINTHWASAVRLLPILEINSYTFYTVSSNNTRLKSHSR